MRAALCEVLEGYGFRSTGVGTRADAVAGAASADLVLLDLGLPDGDGLDVCTEIAGTTSLIVVSARGAEADRVCALELGADDYLAKPFGPRELVARCRSVLRRTETTRTVIRSGDLEVDVDRFEARRGDVTIELTTKERELLVALAVRRGALVRREELADEVWGAPLWSVARSIDVHLSSLRRKLDDDPRAPRHIATVHGLGYRLVR